jgi:hypothetical protein
MELRTLSNYFRLKGQAKMFYKDSALYNKDFRLYNKDSRL